MDKARTDKKKSGKPWYIAGGVLAVILITAFLNQLKPALPKVDAAVIWPDTVKRGAFVREVKGPGTLVPQDIRIIPAMTSGRVEQVYMRPGQTVEVGTLLMRMTNPDVQLQLLNAQSALSRARSEALTMSANLQSQVSSAKAAIAAAQSAYNIALRDMRTQERLAENKLNAANEVARAKDALEEAEQRLEAAKTQHQVVAGSIDEQLKTQKQNIAQLEAQVAYNVTLLESMDVRSIAPGVVQGLDLQQGQWVQAGAELARVVQPGRLKAVIKIPETQIQDVAIGQKAWIDTRNDTIAGTVVRIDPAAQVGSFGVEISIDGPLPPSARPDLSIDGTVEIDRLNDVLYMARPSYGQANGTIMVYKISPDGKTAEQVSVKLGRTSVNQVEVLQGLKKGDVVILSPMDQYQSYTKVRLQ